MAEAGESRRGNMTCPVTGDGPIMRSWEGRAVTALSVYEEAVREADRHKWIESQKQGRDLGKVAVRE